MAVSCRAHCDSMRSEPGAQKLNPFNKLSAILFVSDRNAVLWFGVSADGAPESRPINLRNAWSRDLTASLIVRSVPPVTDQGPFSIAGGEGPGPQAKVALAPGATTPCMITYRSREMSGMLQNC